MQERSGAAMVNKNTTTVMPRQSRHQLCLLNNRVLPMQFVEGLNRGWPTPLRRGGSVFASGPVSCKMCVRRRDETRLAWRDGNGMWLLG